MIIPLFRAVPAAPTALIAGILSGAPGLLINPPGTGGPLSTRGGRVKTGLWPSTPHAFRRHYLTRRRTSSA